MSSEKSKTQTLLAVLCSILGVEGKQDPESKTLFQKAISWILGFCLLIFLWVNAHQNRCETVQMVLSNSFDAYYQSLDQRQLILDSLLNDQPITDIQDTINARQHLKADRAVSSGQEDKFLEYLTVEADISTWVNDQSHLENNPIITAELWPDLLAAQSLVTFYEGNLMVQTHYLLSLASQVLNQYICGLEFSERLGKALEILEGDQA